MNNDVELSWLCNKATYSSNKELIVYLIFIFVLIYTLYQIYKLLSLKEIYSDLTDQQWRTNEIQKLYIPGDLPAFYPNSWLPVYISSDLQCNQIKPINAFGNDLVVYRGKSGKSYVMDAYCPHLGANLGIEGTIIGESVKCPFHGWVFNNEGMCAKVPGIECDSLPKARVKHWNSIEMNGFIYVWYHSEDSEPDWYPTECREIKEDKLITQGKSINIANTHIQDLWENTADFMHIHAMHSHPGFLGLVLEVPKHLEAIIKLSQSVYQFNWKASTVEKHKAKLTINNTFGLLGKTLGKVNLQFHLEGPGIAYSKISLDSIFLRTQIYVTTGIIQLAPMKMKLIHHFYTKPGLLTSLLSKYLMFEFNIQAARDVLIWNNKKYLKRPYFAKNESPLVEYRRWYNQFNSDKNDKSNQNKFSNN